MLSYELLAVAGWSVASLILGVGVLLGHFKWMTDCGHIVIKETPLRRTLFTYLQLLVLLLLLAALGVDSWAVYPLDHGMRLTLDTDIELVTLGVLTTRSSYDNDQRVMYSCTAANVNAGIDGPAGIVVIPGEAQSARPLRDLDRCQTVKASGAFLLCWNILASGVSLLLFIYVRRTLQSDALSERICNRLVTAIPRLCTVQLTCMQAALAVWAVGGEEPLVVAQDVTKGMGVPLLGTSFVLGALAVAAAVPVSLFYTNKDSSLYLPFDVQERPSADAPAPAVATSDVGSTLSHQQLHVALMRSVHRNEPLPPELLAMASTRAQPRVASAANLSDNSSPLSPIPIESALGPKHSASRNAEENIIDGMSVAELQTH